MRILFFTKIDFANPATGGLWKKVNAQVRAFRQFPGVQADLLFRQGNEIKLATANEPGKTWPLTGALARFRFTTGGWRSLPGLGSYDVLYIRHFLLNPGFVRSLKSWKNESKGRQVFLELPTYPYKPEFRDTSISLKLQVGIDTLSVGYLHDVVDRIVTFSRLDSIFNIPTICTDNAVDPESVGKINTIPGPPFRILGLANLNIWHGYDRILQGLANGRFSPNEVRFEIAGTGKEEANLRTLTQKLGLQEQVTFHGYMSGQPLDDLIAQCHVGVASLGMHRTGVSTGQTSTLKAREFAARGLPFLLGYQDHDFPASYPYYLSLPADETPIDIPAIRQFYTALKDSRPNYFREMQADAVARLSWVAKLQPVIEALGLQ